MKDDLRAVFMPRFIDTARARLERAALLLARRDDNALAGELHALGGEAAMLGLEEFADSARGGEIGARRGDLAACQRSLRTLGESLEQVVARGGPGGAP
ncbi:MAG: Hpt domain-containing protein [Deltaproteobacteria bacterium]|nr:Hpt domain-containing protein [Deltaproteobacteria bacterium]